VAFDADLGAEPAVVSLIAGHEFTDRDSYHAAYELGIRAYWAGREAAALDIEVWWWGGDDERARVASVARGGHGRQMGPVPWAPRSSGIRPVAPVIAADAGVGVNGLRQPHARTTGESSRGVRNRRRDPLPRRRRVRAEPSTRSGSRQR
jgi:hypothetical protein